jgi:hypothetical protein
MARQRILNLPVGGLDSDSENRLIDFKDYRYALNIRNGISYIKKLGGTTNVKGNKKVVKTIYSYSGTAPTGRNRCIGAFEDKQSDSIIYFVQNSQFNDQIFRYFPNKIDANNPYGEIHQICLMSMGWTQWTKITSVDLVNGKLLYWTDNVQPRKLNIEKAGLVDKHKTWVVHYPKTNPFTSGGNLNFTYKENGIGKTFNFSIQSFDDASLAVKQIEVLLNQGLSTKFKFEACKCKLEITEIGTDITEVLLTGLNGVTNPENYYGEVFTDRYINIVKYPPTFNPTAIYRKDTSRKFNYVRNRVFQFRLQYVYDDNEKSALSPISQIAGGNVSVNSAQANSLNYIDVDFNNPDLEDPRNWTLIKWIRVFALERNDGKWQQIADLDPCEYYDVRNGLPYFHYKFYNDVNSKGVDTALAAKLYDDVPIKNQSQKYVKNRLVMAGITQNYDAPECLDAKITQEFSDGFEPKFEITAKIRIVNPSYNGNAALNLLDIRQIKGAIVKFPSQEGVFDIPVWGGLPTQVNQNAYGNSTFNTEQGQQYEQWLPEGGFVGYLAGTDFVSVSKQVFTSPFTPSLLGNSGAFDGQDMLVDKSYLAYPSYKVPNVNSGLVKVMTDNGSDVYSLLTISDVPNGTYVLRLASHWCSFPNPGETTDKLGKGQMYNLNNRRAIQKTSTNVIAVKDSGGTIRNNTFELVVTVNNGNVYAGEFFIEDQTSCYQFRKGAQFDQSDLNYSGYRHSIGVSGYLVDNDGKYTDADLKTAIAMEKQWVGIALQCDLKNALGITVAKDAIPYIQFPYFDGMDIRPACNFVPTDHNGYFVFTRRDDWRLVNWLYQGLASTPTLAFTYTITNLRISTRYARGFDVNGNEILINSLVTYQSDSVLNDIFTGGLTPYTITAFDGGWVGCNQYSYKQFLMPCVLPLSSSQLKTFINGQVADTNGDGWAGVNVVFTGTGRVGLSDNDGDWTIPIYANSLSQPYQQRDDSVIYILNGFTATFSNNNFNNAIIGIGTTYTISQPFTATLNPTTISIQNDLYGKDHKRGGNYIYALRYYDYGGRLCSVVSAPNLNIYIPFITEDLNAVLPDQYLTPNTYKNGKVTLNWELLGKPPEWAYTYQWMRTRDNNYLSYLSWITNSVKYISKTFQDEDNPEIVTSYSNGDATNIMLDISNLAQYKRIYPDSNLFYEFQAGDKIRLIRKQDGTYYEGLFEYEVVSFQTTGSYLIVKNDIGAPEIKAGTQFEVFSRRNLEDEKGQIFYEVGECYPCTAPDSNSNDYSVTSAPFTNGDTYWNPRTILVNDVDTQFTGTFSYIFESSSISDFYESKDSDIGRIGTINRDFVRQFRPTLHVVSNVFIPDTQVNGLSNFESLNSKELDRTYGLVERLIHIGETLYSVCHNKLVSNYIGRRILSEAASDTGVVSIADEFLGTDRATEKDYGTQNGESVIVQDNNVYGVDAYRGLVWRHAENGTTEISAINNRSYFKDALKDGVFDIFGGMDRYYSEYIITITKSVFLAGESVTFEGIDIAILFDELPALQIGETIDVSFYSTQTQSTITYRTAIKLIDGNKVIVEAPIVEGFSSKFTLSNPSIKYRGESETISWSEEKNKWITFYSFKPENYGIVGMKFASFLNGEVWLHDVNEVRNNFYDAQHNSKITPVFSGENTSEKKVWEVAKLEQFQTDQKSNWSAPSITNDYNQFSRLAQTFVKKEEHWSNPFKRDLSDVTVPVNSRILNGRMLRSTTLTVEFENDYTDEFTLKALVAEYIESKAY